MTTPINDLHSMQTLEILKAYIAFITASCPDGEDGAEKLLLALRIYKHDLRRRLGIIPAPPNWVYTLHTGRRIAEELLADIFADGREEMAGWHSGSQATNHLQRVTNILLALILELSGEINALEAETLTSNP